MNAEPSDIAHAVDPESMPIVQQLRTNIAILEQIVENGSNPIDKEKIVTLSIENANLKSQIISITAERDAAVRDMQNNTKCFICMHLPADGNMAHCKHYAACGLNYIHWKWRGAKENNNANQKD